MTRYQKLKRLKEQQEQYRRFCAMKEWHYGQKPSQKNSTTFVQELRKNAILSTMTGNYRT